MALSDLYIVIAFLSFLLLFLLIFLYVTLRNELFRRVERTSRNIQKAKELRNEYTFRRIIWPRRTITQSAKSYSSYKQKQYHAILEKRIKYNADNLRLDLSSADHNRKIYERYLTECRDAYSPTPSFVIGRSGLTENMYTKIEKRLLKHILIPTSVYDVTVNIVISYNSPKGKRHYSKSKVFDYDSVIGMYHKWEKRQNYESRKRRERAKITPDVRYNVLARDGFRCRICGTSAEEGAILEVDHIIPLSKGGLSTSDNLQTLCRDCNVGKSDKFPNEILLGRIQNNQRIN